MIYYRDPLLDKICDRITDLAEPAFIKNSELIYVAVNDAYAALFNCTVTDLVGTGRGDHEELEAQLRIEDKERACLVFGDEQQAYFSDPFGKGRFRIELERFTLADGQAFLYGVFADQKVVPFEPLRAIPDPKPAEGANLPPAHQKTPGGVLDSRQLEQLAEELEVGLCIWSKDLKLVYFNERLRTYYEGFFDDLHLGMDLRESMIEAYEKLARTFPDAFPPSAEDRMRVVEEKLAHCQRERSSDCVKLPNGRWVQVVNRRQTDGSILGLRIDVTEMKNREQLLEEHIEHVSLYRELLNRLPVPAFVRGPDRKLAFLNQAYADFFGRSYEQLVGTDIDEVISSDPQYARYADIANAHTLETGEEFAHEEDVPVANGRMARSLVKIGRMVTTKGTPFIVGTLVDISAIRERELQLKDAIEQAETARQDIENIVSMMDIGLIVLDRDLNIQLMNAAYRKLISVGPEECGLADMVGRPLRDLMYENFARGRSPTPTGTFDDYYEQRVAEIRSGRVEPRESLLINGRSLLHSSIPLSGGRSLLCYVDLTELRRRDFEVAEAHEDAQKALQLVRTATDMMPEGLMVLEGEHIVFANGSLARLFDVPERLIVAGARWEDLYRATALQNRAISQSDIDDGVERFRNALADRKDISYDFPLDRERWVHLEMRACANGQTVVICSDETTVIRREAELKRLVAKAEAADRAKSEFLANIGLEIRTPMNGILGMAELLSKSQLDTRQKAFTDIIIKSGKTLLTVINDVLDISKLDAGNLELRYAPFDPAEAIDDVASLFAFKAVEKDLELIVRHADDVPRQVMGDAVRFRQIVTNLLSNALKFTERGHVIVSTGVVSDGLEQPILGISVEDTGIGIPAGMLGAIFEKFSRVETSGGRREGTGLGLSIARRLAHLLGGTISVHSTENKGSTFTFSLPVQVAEAHAKAKPLPANVAGARVIIADDHQAARDHLIEQVSSWGFECVGAADCDMALSILDAACESGVRVDVLLLDSQLADADGVPLAARVRADHRHTALSIVTMASRGDDGVSDLADNPNVQAEIMKPVRTPQLRELLVEVVRASRMPRQHPDILPMRTEVEHAGSPRKQNPEPASVHLRQPGSRRSYILVAEDNDVNGLFFSQILEAAGFDFTLVRDGREAVDAWQQERPSLILMDTAMPVLDGFEATRLIRAIEATTGGHTPVIGVLASTQDSEYSSCAASGMDDYISKPINPERLEEKIRQWLKQRMLTVASGEGRG